MAHTLQEAAAWIDGTVVGDAGTVWNRAMSLLDAEAGDLVLIDNPKKLGDWAKSPAAAAVVPPNFPAGDRPIIRVAEPLKAYLRLIQKLRGDRAWPRAIHPTVIVDPTAILGANISIGPRSMIGSRTILGDNCTIGMGVCVGSDCRLGRDNTLHPGVVLYDDTVLGDRVEVHANSVIGSDGYGYRTEAGKHVKIPQLGYVDIGNDVEIGASVTIDRGTIGPTRIGEGTKIDNLVMIAHNCQIGRHNLIVAQVGIAGSSSTGDYVVLGGQSGVVDHIHVGEHSMIAAATAVTRSIPPNSQVAGNPSMPVREFLRAVTNWKKLSELRRTVAELERNLAPPRSDS